MGKYFAVSKAHRAKPYSGLSIYDRYSGQKFPLTTGVWKLGHELEGSADLADKSCR